MDNVIKRIIEVRKSLNLNQKDFTEEIGAPNGVISKIEASNRKIDAITLLAMHERFGISPNYIILGEGDAILQQETSVAQQETSETKYLRLLLSEKDKENEWLKKHANELMELLKKQGNVPNKKKGVQNFM